MKLSADHFNDASLAAHGAEALVLIVRGDIPALAERFGYALAFGRDLASAIQSDLSSVLAELGAASVVLAPAQATQVAYFKPNDTGLVAVVEARAQTNIGKPILVELVVSGSGTDMHLTLEQISAAA
jgi:hypothetical protein